MFVRVLDGLEAGWSPQQIAGRLSIEPVADLPPVGSRTIYRHVQRLRRAKSLLTMRWPRPPRRRKPRRTAGSTIIGRVTIDHRPLHVATRRQPGHWEGDTLVGRPGKAVVATFVERRSRYLVAFRLPSRHSQRLSRATCAELARRVPRSCRRTITVDNGTEFADFKTMESRLGVRVYFADPHSPWQRGTNENTNGLLRHFVPKSTDLTQVTQADINRFVRLINNRPRKCLNWRTPAEALEASLSGK
jgi:IS30 family transposase